MPMAQEFSTEGENVPQHMEQSPRLLRKLMIFKLSAYMIKSGVSANLGGRNEVLLRCTVVTG